MHHIALEWLQSHCGSVRYERAIDVACGTRDSSLPLLEICNELCCTDSSEEMLSFARNKGLNAYAMDYSEIAKLGRFDLISTCMAFHWFDPQLAIDSYKSASNPGAIWFIYNFAFGGHESNQEFNDWLHRNYLEAYPSPPRNRTATIAPDADDDIELLGEGCGWLPIQLSHETLFGYLSTQSNIENALRNGADLKRIKQSLQESLETIDVSGAFKYSYTYAIYQYHGI